MVQMMWWNHGGWDTGDWFAMSLMMVLFWGGLIALVVWIVRSLRTDQRNGAPPTTPHADDVLAERFARGEIDDDEFTRRRELLHTTSGKPS
jgi:putative membrane protein